VAFVVAKDAVAWIGEPHRTVGVHREIVGRIEGLALEAVGHHGDGSVVLGTSDTAGIVLASDEIALPVAGVAVAVIRRLAEDADFAGVFKPAQDAVVGDVAP
jgi:hypothetical protein